MGTSWKFLIKDWVGKDLNKSTYHRVVSEPDFFCVQPPCSLPCWWIVFLEGNTTTKTQKTRRLHRESA